MRRLSPRRRAAAKRRSVVAFDAAERLQKGGAIAWRRQAFIARRGCERIGAGLRETAGMFRNLRTARRRRRRCGDRTPLRRREFDAGPAESKEHKAYADQGFKKKEQNRPLSSRLRRSEMVERTVARGS